MYIHFNKFLIGSILSINLGFFLEFKFSLELEVPEAEVGLDDAGGLDSGPEHVLLCGHVGGAGDAVQGVQVVGGGVVQLVLPAASGVVRKRKELS